MQVKKLIVCFDVVNARVTKALKFQDNIDVSCVEEMSIAMSKAQIDEIIFFDILASAEKRSIDIETVKKVADNIFVPFVVGGGIKTVDDINNALRAGANKVSIDSMAVRNPQLIADGVKAFGSDVIMLSTQVLKNEKMKCGYEVYIDGARTATGFDAIEWIKRGQDLGAGEICINSIDKDGTMSGYDIPLMRKAGNAVSVPLIASGGAGKPEHLKEIFTETKAEAAIISSMLYSPRTDKKYTVKELKEYLIANGITCVL
ncbi:MAG: imidazole glycerol phosphate synthase cyclase subunit [Oscillospiraceae bacterium]|jgi:cyclase|nr:imidazole glycerol phosphate synthase cyclase subunit [Oscillospiraceae bacterium]